MLLAGCRKSLKPLLQLSLLTIFLVYFGLPAIQRFGEEKVMVISSRRDTGGIETLAISIATVIQESGQGWKNASVPWKYNIEE